MEEYVKRVFQQIGDFYRSLTAGRKLAVMGVTVAIAVSIVGLFLWAGRQQYRPLMSDLAPEDSANVIRVLREKNIPFRVENGGRNVSVPPESVDQLRLELATSGLPQSGVVGYEVFDKSSLGTTSFVQKINQKRALEGELMRTIASIHGVRRARVHLALPQKSAFVEDQKKPTASVALDIEPGATLHERQISGIGNLVARAIEGMDPSDVVIVDAQGKQLSRNASDPLALASATQLDVRRKVEQEMEGRIEQMLSRVVGEGRVVARVSAELDFAQVNETQTSYDPDGAAVRSIERDTQSMEGSRPSPMGAAGVASNQPGQPPATNSAAVRTDTKRSNERTNYEVPQTVRRTVKPGHGTTRLSVAVVVDGKQVKEEKDGKVLAKTVPWAPDKLKEFEDIVASAVGIDRKRGDTLEIKNMEFSREDFDEAQKMVADNERKAYVNNMILYSVIGLVILLFFLFVVRPFMKWITENTIDSVDTFLPQTIEELEKLQKNSALPGLEDVVPVLPEKIDPEKVEGEMIKEKIVTLVDSNPHKAALILRDWLHDSKKKNANGEDEKGGPSPAPGGPGKTKSA